MEMEKLIKEVLKDSKFCSESAQAGFYFPPDRTQPNFGIYPQLSIFTKQHSWAEGTPAFAKACAFAKAMATAPSRSRFGRARHADGG